MTIPSDTCDSFNEITSMLSESTVLPNWHATAKLQLILRWRYLGLLLMISLLKQCQFLSENVILTKTCSVTSGQSLASWMHCIDFYTIWAHGVPNQSFLINAILLNMVLTTTVTTTSDAAPKLLCVAVLQTNVALECDKQ